MLKRFIGTKAFYRNVLALLIPMVIQQFITSFVSLLDNIMVGSLGTEAISAASISNSVLMVHMLAIFGGMSQYCDFSNSFTRWMSKRSFGLYVFHYLGISSVALLFAKPGRLPPAACYILSLVMGFVFGYGLYEIISRIPFMRWAVLGIGKKKEG